ncbi:MAG: MBL fold metallo-hydrolase [Deltaproteobacteria bacterium]|nr:MBL fold metallo-hydrolase [Deltaproteobacteria bacterium]MBW2094487.1 MBL fold metallo-hydrolase [Deltaproteobacteria bacterium]
MRITILYDNTIWKEGLQADWGFSCLVEVNQRKILFDTGGNGSILLYNMKKLNIDPRYVDEIFLSHPHWDHAGGLQTVLSIKSTKVYIPASFAEPKGAGEIVRINGPLALDENIYSTGALMGFEQSLAVRMKRGLVVIAGCSHPGVGRILEAASRFGRPFALIGGLHGFSDFDLIKGLDIVCPTHCTQYKSMIRSLYPEKYVEGGVGRILEIEE